MVEQSSAAIVGVVNYKSGGNRFAQEQDGQSVASGTGSGVIYNADNHYAYIVTNNHVIEGAEKIEVSLESGETTTAELVGSDALSDLAVLKIDAKYADTLLNLVTPIHFALVIQSSQSEIHLALISLVRLHKGLSVRLTVPLL